MANYRFPPQIALDPSTGQIIRNTVGNVYSPDDTAYANPLNVTDDVGNTFSDIAVNAQGLTPEFNYTESPVVWRSGGTSPITLWSPKQFSDVAEAALAAAEAAATAAQDAAQNTQAPTEEVVTSVLNTGSFAPTGTFDFTAAVVTGLTGGGNTSDVVVTDHGSYATLSVLDGGSVVVTDHGTYATLTI